MDAPNISINISLEPVTEFIRNLLKRSDDKKEKEKSNAILFDEAITEAERRLRFYKLSPLNSDPNENIDQKILKSDLLYDAINLYKFANRINGNEIEKSDLCFSVGQCYEFFGEWHDAANYYEKCLKHNPLHKKAFMRLGEAKIASYDQDELVDIINKYAYPFLNNRRIMKIIRDWEKWPLAEIPEQPVTGFLEGV